MNIVNELIARDLVLGTLAKEATECSEENKNMAALACLFILVEQAVKLTLDRTDGVFYQLLKTARKEKLISDKEYSVLDRLRQIRNRMFHETHYAWFYEKEGIFYPFSEDETKQKIFDEFSGICFGIVLKLLEETKSSES